MQRSEVVHQLITYAATQMRFLVTLDFADWSDADLQQEIAHIKARGSWSDRLLQLAEAKSGPEARILPRR